MALKTQSRKRRQNESSLKSLIIEEETETNGNKKLKRRASKKTVQTKATKTDTRPSTSSKRNTVATGRKGIFDDFEENKTTTATISSDVEKKGAQKQKGVKKARRETRGSSAKLKKKQIALVAKPGCSKFVVQAPLSSSGSEDEWLDVEEGTEDFNAEIANHDVEVTIKEVPSVETEESKAAKCLRLEINKRIRERHINCHKVHLLCYIAHLRFWVRILVRSEFLKPLCFSLIPDGYITAALHCFDVSLAERFLKWLTSAFTISKVMYSGAERSSSAKVDRLEKLINDKVYEDDKDLALIAFLFFLALKQSVRLVLSCQPMSLKVSLGELIAPRKEKESVIGTATSRFSTSTESGQEKLKKATSEKGNCQKSNESKKQKRNLEKISFKRNYWIEYWDETAERWICVDPWMKTVDLPKSIEEEATAPMHYVLAVDDDFGLRDVTSRYAARYLYHEIRRLRVDPNWWNPTVKLFRSRNRARERMEEVELHDYLMSQPMPTNLADFKNHPLYVLKKDLLKYEAIYPPDQPSVGKIRGVEVYPRSSVYHLDGSLNWIKKARSIKPGEKPYKVVKARPDIRVPKEERQSDRTLDLYGFWQTEPYVPPKVINGRIPRNEHGNMYLYKKSMLPEGCAYLQLDGLYGIARRLNLECVACVVGWEFHKNGNHPILDGFAVLKEDEQVLRDAWSNEFEKKVIRLRQKRRERAKKNWRRLYRGVIFLRKVRAEFSTEDNRSMNVDEQLENRDSERDIEEPVAYSWPRAELNLPLTEGSPEDE